MNSGIGVDDRTHLILCVHGFVASDAFGLTNAFASPVEVMSPSEYSLTSEFN